MPTISKDFIQHLEKQGLTDEQQDLCLEYCQRPLRRSIRINSLKMKSATLAQDWQAKGYSLQKIPWLNNGYWINESEKTLPAGLGNLIEHQAGLFYIQEASSMLPVSALFAANPNPHYVLDMAAAPGSKTTQIAAQMQNNGLIIANELSSSRLKGLFSNVQRCGVSNTALTHYDASLIGEMLPESFDAILLDAPCGGEGTVRKDPDALTNWSLDSVLSMATLQKKLIISAYKALKPGGTLVYSTCTLSKEENQQVCEHLLEYAGNEIDIFDLSNLFNGAQKATTQEGYLHVFPHIFDSEGFFVACFTKTQQASNLEKTAPSEKKLGKFPFTPIKTKMLQNFSQYCLHFCWDIDAIKDHLWCRNDEVWYFPNGIEHFIGKIKLDRTGVKLANAFKKGFRLEHQAAVTFGSHFSKNGIELTSDQAQAFYQGQDIYPEQSLDDLSGEIAVSYQGVTIGLGKKVGTRLKNNLPRDLVRDGSFIFQR